MILAEIESRAGQPHDSAFDTTQSVENRLVAVYLSANPRHKFLRVNLTVDHHSRVNGMIGHTEESEFFIYGVKNSIFTNWAIL